MSEVVLSSAELLMANFAATMRHTGNINKGRVGRYGGATSGPDALAMHSVGCVGEMAVSKALNIYWGSFYGGRLDMKDVGNFQVRTRTESWHDLILHDDDAPDDVFILVTYDGAKTCILRGWIFARDGQKKEYWKDPAGGRPAYFVPQSALRSVDELSMVVQP